MSVEHSRWRSRLDGVMTVAMVGLIGLLGWRLLREPSLPLPPPPPPATVPVEPVSLDGAPLRGAATAPLTLLVFEDFWCSACALFEREAMPTLLRDYVEPGRVRLAVHTIGLPGRGPGASQDADLVPCAIEHGKFWEFRAAMFGRPTPSAETGGSVLARVLGAATTSCVDSSANTEAVVAVATKAGVMGTPYFLLGHEVHNGLQVVAVRRGSGQGDRWLRDWLGEHVY